MNDLLTQRMINKTTNTFAKDQDSNLYKLFSLISDSIDTPRKRINEVYSWQDINNAAGKVLDDIGKEYSISRPDDDDNFYRFLLNNARVKNHTDGSVDSLIRLISVSLGADFSEFHLKAGYENDGEVLSISIEDIPNKYNQDERKTRMLMKNIEQSVAAGIKLTKVTFQDNNTSHIYLGSTHEIVYEENNYMNGGKK